MNSRENGSYNLALLALDYSAKISPPGKVSKSDVRSAIDTVKAVRWPKEIILKVGPVPTNTFFRRLRGANISTIEYSSLQNILTDPIKADHVPIDLWALWGALILKYDLYKSAPPHGTPRDHHYDKSGAN